MKALNKTLLVAAITLTGSSFTSFAATDGALGETSEGTSVVTIIKENVVQISNVDDLNLGSFSSLTADMSAFDEVCVFNSTSSYSVTVDSANTAFELRNGSEAIPYAVSWTSQANPAVTVAQGVGLAGNLGSRNSPNCNGGTNASFEVQVSAADFNSAIPGTYTDTLTLMIEPE